MDAFDSEMALLTELTDIREKYVSACHREHRVWQLVSVLNDRLRKMEQENYELKSCLEYAGKRLQTIGRRSVPILHAEENGHRHGSGK